MLSQRVILGAYERVVWSVRSRRWKAMTRKKDLEVIRPKEGRTHYDVWVPPALVLQWKKILDFKQSKRPKVQVSAWNHISNLQRQGPPRRRTRKVLSLWHTHGSAPRSSYISGLPFFCSMETFGARQKNEMSSEKQNKGDVLPLTLLSGLSFVFCGQCNTGDFV